MKRISLRSLLLVVAACAAAAWWSQRPLEVVSPEALRFADGGRVVEAGGHRVETYHRRPGDIPLQHGPVRTYDDQGDLVFEEHYRAGVRHGLYRRWDIATGDLLVELEFNEGALVRVNDLPVEDLFAGTNFSGKSGERVRQALESVTSFEYVDAPLGDVLADIGIRLELPVQIDWRGLREANLLPPPTITSSDRGMPLFAALTANLSQVGLVCLYRFDVICVTAPGSELITTERLKADAAGAALDEQLARDVQLDYLDTDLADVFADLAERTKIPIELDQQATGRVTLSLPKIPLASALRLMLHDLDLHGEAHGDSLVIKAE